jgi:carbon-monoxide dehydrogenase medium subunit
VPAAFRTALEPGELVQAIRIPPPSEGARWGYYKACRKPGEFAFAMAAVLVDGTRGVRRAAIGAVGGPPVILEGERVVPEAVETALAGSGLDPIERRQQAVALKRALAQAAA